MVQEGEVHGLAPVRVWAYLHGGLEGPGLQANAGSFFGEEDVVEVGEQRDQPFAGPVFAGVDDAVAGLRLRGRLSILSFPGRMGGDRETGAAGFDLDLAQRSPVGDEAVGAEVASAPGDEVEHDVVSAAVADHVPCYVMSLAHVADSSRTPMALRGITVEIYSAIDRMVLRVGELLEEGRQSTSKAGFERWVINDLPFGLDTARRFRAIFLAFRELPEEMLTQMPRPWQALYALTSVERPVLERAIADGTIRPNLTVVETREVARGLKGAHRPHISQVDVWVARLVRFPADELSDDSRERVARWLAGDRPV